MVQKRLKKCFEEIQVWMMAHFLKLSDFTTDFLIIGAPKDVNNVTG